MNGLIWIYRYIDDDQLVVNFKKQDPELKWPDIMESWESLAAGSSQLLKGTSIYLVGDSTEINLKVAEELATGLGYLLLSPLLILITNILSAENCNKLLWIHNYTKGCIFMLEG